MIRRVKADVETSLRPKIQVSQGEERQSVYVGKRGMGQGREKEGEMEAAPVHPHTYDTGFVYVFVLCVCGWV
jgi:hypothetical protein